jgi:hypothetical protein
LSSSRTSSTTCRPGSTSSSSSAQRCTAGSTSVDCDLVRVHSPLACILVLTAADVPPSIAKIMDTTTPDAAVALNAQLDRKITIVNFDLHRLQDDLNDSISSSHFASAMLKFLPDIQRLALLPQGPRHAFDLVLKLGGNLNSHGGIDSADAGDIAARRDFYSKLDVAMVDVVTRRFGEGEEWSVQREIKRIEKTASYLKTYGVEPYFPNTLETMKRELEFQPHGNGVPNGQGTPPRYH